MLLYCAFDISISSVYFLFLVWYSLQLQQLYRRNDAIGSTFRRLTKRLNHNRFIDVPINLPHQSAPQLLETLEPRVSLRFAGSYYFMGYFCWVMILARLFGFSWLFIMFMVLFIFMICVLCHIDSPPRQVRRDF